MSGRDQCDHGKRMGEYDACFVLHEANLLEEIPCKLRDRIQLILPKTLVEQEDDDFFQDDPVDMVLSDAKGLELLIWMLSRGYATRVAVDVNCLYCKRGRILIRFMHRYSVSFMKGIIDQLAPSPELIGDVCHRSLHPKVLHTLRLVKNSINDEVTLTSMAAQVGLTPNHLARLYRRELGISFIQYLNRSRIDHAIRLLKSGLPVNAAMYESGFRNAQYFYKQFKKQTSMTPKDFLIKA